MKFIVREPEREYEFLLDQGLYIVGRHRSCDLPLKSDKVSRRHMSCTVGESEVKIEDLGSRNGVYVGGVRVQGATLKHGDKIKLGDVTLVFEGGQPQGAEGAAPLQAAPESPKHPPGQPVSIEDEEQTPLDDSLLPSVSHQLHPKLVQRGGKWYAVEPESGRQVEVVPVQGALAGKRAFVGTAGRQCFERRV